LLDLAIEGFFVKIRKKEGGKEKRRSKEEKGLRLFPH
jgi:hypothetical protein